MDQNAALVFFGTRRSASAITAASSAFSARVPRVPLIATDVVVSMMTVSAERYRCLSGTTA
jgi:hypothetical protein